MTSKFLLIRLVTQVKGKKTAGFCREQRALSSYLVLQQGPSIRTRLGRVRFFSGTADVTAWTQPKDLAHGSQRRAQAGEASEPLLETPSAFDFRLLPRASWTCAPGGLGWTGCSVFPFGRSAAAVKNNSCLPLRNIPPAGKLQSSAWTPSASATGETEIDKNREKMLKNKLCRPSK